MDDKIRSENLATLLNSELAKCQVLTFHDVEFSCTDFLRETLTSILCMIIFQLELQLLQSALNSPSPEAQGN